MMWTVWAWFMGGPIRYKLAMTGARIAMPLSEVSPLASRHVGRWTRGRESPEVAQPRFPKLVEDEIGTITNRKLVPAM